MKWEKQLFGGWESRISKEAKTIGRGAVHQALDFVNLWREVFPKEETWVQKTYGIPSLIVKLDCVFIDGFLFIYEVDERPDGIGIANTINHEFSARLNLLKRKWPLIKWVKSDNRCPGDDSFWLDGDPLTLDEYLEYLSQPEPQRKGVVLVRAEPSETEFHQLQNRSISLIANEGLKSYGLSTGLWKEVNYWNADSLPWKYGFVLKPLQGSKCKDVEIWHPGRKHFNHLSIGGISSESKVRQTLEKNRVMYCQPLVLPMQTQVENQPFFFIYRLYLGYHVGNKAYEPLGGTWVGRLKNFKVHGSEDSIFGPLVLEQKT